MRMNKSFVSLPLALLLTFTLLPFTPARADFAFPYDIPSAWAHAEIVDAIQRGLVPTELQKNFHHNATRLDVTRLAVAFVEVSYGAPITDVLKHKGLDLPQPFDDCDDPNVLAAVALEIVVGIGDGSFRPDIPLTREIVAVLLTKTMYVLGVDVSKAPPTVYNDQNDISNWAVGSVNFVSYIGVMVSINPMNDFFPDGLYVNEQLIVTFARALDWMLNSGWVIPDPIPNPKWGYVLDRDTITVADASLAFRGVLGLVELTPIQRQAAALDGSGVPTIGHVLRIFRFALGLSETL
jgi:hypothetical protein